MKMDTPSDLPSLPTPRPSAPFGCRVVCVCPHTSGGWVREDGLEVRKGGSGVAYVRHSAQSTCAHHLYPSQKYILFPHFCSPAADSYLPHSACLSPLQHPFFLPPLHSLHHPPPTTPPPASACSAPFRRTFRTLAAVALMLLHKNVRAVLMAACECEAH